MQTGLKYILLILLFGISQCQKTDPGETVSIPDSNFLKELFAQGVDANGDGQISKEEAESKTALSLGPSGISHLTGIESFVNLDTLVVEVNPLIPPDLSQNKALRYLNCTGNEGLDSFLETLDLSGNPELETLILLGNELIALDVGANLLLSELKCKNNLLKSLDLSGNTSLVVMACCGNQLSSIDLSQNTKLVAINLP